DRHRPPCGAAPCAVRAGLQAPRPRAARGGGARHDALPGGSAHRRAAPPPLTAVAPAGAGATVRRSTLLLRLARSGRAARSRLRLPGLGLRLRRGSRLRARHRSRRAALVARRRRRSGTAGRRRAVAGDLAQRLDRAGLAVDIERIGRVAAIGARVIVVRPGVLDAADVAVARGLETLRDLVAAELARLAALLARGLGLG